MPFFIDLLHEFFEMFYEEDRKCFRLKHSSYGFLKTKFLKVESLCMEMEN